MMNRNLAIAAGLLASAVSLTALKVSAQDVSGDVLADGSSTVGPVTIAAAESFQAVAPSVNTPKIKKLIPGPTLTRKFARARP